uniref:Uncharacterized protein n=1 Tax=Rhizophora mucronata TaxID=61149 RepID=A0A2P2MG32_RHIMU
MLCLVAEKLTQKEPYFQSVSQFSMATKRSRKFPFWD